VVTLAEAAQSPEQIGLAETDAWFEPSGLPAVGAITSGANKWANSSSYTTEYDDWIEGQSGQGAVSTASVLDGFKGAVFTGVLTRLVNSQGDPRTAGRSHEVWVLCKWDAADGGTVVNNWHTGSQDRLLQDSSNNLVITRQNTSTTVWATSMDTNWHLIRWQETENGANDDVKVWVDGDLKYSASLVGRQVNFWAAGDNFSDRDFNGKLVEFVWVNGAVYTVKQANQLLSYYRETYATLAGLPPTHS
jgi:hypothetical protein